MKSCVCTVVWSFSRFQTFAGRRTVFSQVQVLQQHLCIYINRCIVYEKFPDWRVTGKRSRRRVQGICHRVGALLPIESRKTSSAQLYGCDSDMEAQVNMRCCIVDGLDGEIVAIIQCVKGKWTHSSKCSCELANLWEIKRFSTLDWQFTKTRESICEHIIARHEGGCHFTSR